MDDLFRLPNACRRDPVGFFQGAALSDPAALLQGSGRRMRHVKVFWGRPIDTVALIALIAEAYTDIRRRLEPGG